MGAASAAALSPDKEVRELIEFAETLGYVASKTNGNHVAFTHPLVEKPIYGPKTPSEYRSLKNMKSLLRREARRGEAELRQAVQDRNPSPGGFMVDCPSCLKKGVKKGFTSPEGLAWHLADKHAVPLEALAEPEIDPEPIHEQENEPVGDAEVVQIKQEEQASSLERYLRKNFEHGEVVFRTRLVDELGSGVKGRIETLRQRGEKSTRPGMERFQEYNRLIPEGPGAYRWYPAGTVPGDELGTGVMERRAEPESPKKEAAPQETTAHGRVFEVVNQFVDGRFLVRDEEGALFTAEMKPL